MVTNSTSAPAVPWNKGGTATGAGMMGDLVLHTSTPTDYINKQAGNNTCADNKKRALHTPVKHLSLGGARKKKDTSAGEKPYFCPIEGCIRYVVCDISVIVF